MIFFHLIDTLAVLLKISTTTFVPSQRYSIPLFDMPITEHADGAASLYQRLNTETQRLTSERPELAETILEQSQLLRTQIMEVFSLANGNGVPWKEQQRLEKAIGNLEHRARIAAKEDRKSRLPRYQDTPAGTMPPRRGRGDVELGMA